MAVQSMILRFDRVVAHYGWSKVLTPALLSEDQWRKAQETIPIKDTLWGLNDTFWRQAVLIRMGGLNAQWLYRPVWAWTWPEIPAIDEEKLRLLGGAAGRVMREVELTTRQYLGSQGQAVVEFKRILTDLDRVLGSPVGEESGATRVSRPVADSSPRQDTATSAGLSPAPSGGAECPPVILGKRGEGVTVLGQPNPPLKNREYDIISALLSAGRYLTGPELDDQSAHTESRKVLRALAKGDPGGWGAVLDFPGGPWGGGYGFKHFRRDAR
jgi:hypothetical protein